MKTPCCVESGKVCPKTSSCSMILRSSCSHGHSHKSVMVNDVQLQSETHLKRNTDRISSSHRVQLTDSSHDNGQDHSDFSIGQLHSTLRFCSSAKDITSYNSFEPSQFHKKEHFEENGNGSLFINEVHVKQASSFNYLSSEDHSCERFGFNSSAIEEDCKVLKYSNMPRDRRLRRSDLRSLSGSEEDEAAFFGSIGTVTTRRGTYGAISTPTSSISTSHSNVNNHNSSHHVQSSSSVSRSEGRASSSSYSNSTGTHLQNQSANSPESPQAYMSTVQYSTIDRLRWILWRYVYLQLVSSVSFDAWLLSRIHDKKYKVFLIMLLLSLAYLAYHTLDMCLFTRPSYFVSSTLSSMYSVLSSVSSMFSSTITKHRDCGQETVDTSSCPSSLSPAPDVLSYLTNLFVKTDESVTFFSPKTSELPDKTYQQVSYSPNKEELKSLAVEMFDDRFKVVIDHFYRTKIMQENLKAKEETAKEFQREISNLHMQFQSLVESLKQVEKNVKQAEESATSVKQFEIFSKEQNQHFELLNEKVKAFETKLGSLGAIKKCCDEKVSSSDLATILEKHIVTAFRNVVQGGEDPSSPYYFFHEWLNSKLSNSGKLSSEVNTAFEKLQAQLKARQDKESMQVIESIVKDYVESLKTNLSSVHTSTSSLDDSFSVLSMRKVAEEAIRLYDADKTGKVDYALESAGGSVLGTRCSESYTDKEGKLYLLGLPWWSDQNSPRTAIQPNVQPGECWAFKGSQGFLVIQLSYTIYATGFTLEHIPVSLSPTGSLDSAPNEFSVWGLASEYDIQGTLLGAYSYDANGGPLQYFPVQNVTLSPVSYVELKIHSNHGNLEYTCLYRFRVHGTRVK